MGNERQNELAEKAFWADKLGLIAKATDEEAEAQIEPSKRNKLKLDDGMPSNYQGMKAFFDPEVILQTKSSSHSKTIV